MRRNNLLFKALKLKEKSTYFREVIDMFCSENSEMISCLLIELHWEDKDTILAHFHYNTDIDYIMGRVSS